MAETVFRFVLQDEAPPESTGGRSEAPSSSAPGGSGPSASSGSAPVTPTGEKTSTAKSRPQPTPDRAEGGVASMARELLAQAIGRQFDRVPILGSAVRLLDKIASSLGNQSNLSGSAGMVDRLLASLAQKLLDLIPSRGDSGGGRGGQGGGSEPPVRPAAGNADREAREGERQRPTAGEADAEDADWEFKKPETGSSPESSQRRESSEDKDSLSPEEAKELYDKFGLRPEQVGKRVRPAGGEAQREAAETPRPAAGNAGSSPAPAAGQAASTGAEAAAGGAAAGGAAAGGAEAAAGGAATSTALIPVAGGGAIAGAGGGALIAGGGEAAAAGGAVALGPIGLGILAAVAVVGAAILTMRALIEANNALRRQMSAETERLKAFSPDLQLSEARNQIAQLRQDVLQARDLGANLGRFNEAQARIDRAIQRITVAVEGPLLDAVVPLVETVAAAIDFGSKIFATIVKVEQALGLLKPSIVRLVEIQNEMLGIGRREEDRLPAELDILGAFTKEPLLTVTWRGRSYGGNDVEPIGVPTYSSPLPLEPPR